MNNTHNNASNTVHQWSDTNFFQNFLVLRGNLLCKMLGFFSIWRIFYKLKRHNVELIIRKKNACQFFLETFLQENSCLHKNDVWLDKIYNFIS